MRDYKYLLFDLDHTLWDFDKNSSETIMQLYFELELDLYLKSGPEAFIFAYQQHNMKLWKQYESGSLSKEELRWRRFYNAMSEFGYSNSALAKQFAEAYLKICPLKTNLIAYSVEVLEHVSKDRKLIIITNGFEEVQHIKIQKCGLDKYFNHIITSEMAGFKKPHGPIFKFALDKLGARRQESLMIGDSLHSDIIGAKKFGIDQVYYNPQKHRHNQKATYEIQCLSELKSILP